MKLTITLSITAAAAAFILIAKPVPAALCPPWICTGEPNVVTLTADRDTFLRSGMQNTNEGANEILRVRASGKNRALIAFNPLEINTVGLTKASLVLTIKENANNWGKNNDRTVDAHALTEDFEEGNGKIAEVVPRSDRSRGEDAGTTWNCLVDEDITNKKADCDADEKWKGGEIEGFYEPATAPGVIHYNGLEGEVSWDVTEDVKNGAYGWLIKKTNQSATGKVLYYSKEGAISANDPSLSPKLILEY